MILLLLLISWIFILDLAFTETNVFDNYDYDVIIVGAGASGISAAQTLLQHSIDNILIIEAQGT